MKASEFPFGIGTQVKVPDGRVGTVKSYHLGMVTRGVRIRVRFSDDSVETFELGDVEGVE